MGFHDEFKWNNNYGSVTVKLTFDGVAPVEFDIFASQCIYFRWADNGLLGPSPYYEAIDEGFNGASHRPSIVLVPTNATKVDIQVSYDTIKDVETCDSSSVCRVNRFLFNPAKYSELLIQDLLWKRGFNIENYNTFLYDNGNINYAPFDYDCIACDLAKSTIVAIKKSVKASKQKILNSINRRWTTPSTSVGSTVSIAYDGSPNYDLPFRHYFGNISNQCVLIVPSPNITTPLETTLPGSIIVTEDNDEIITEDSQLLAI